MNHWPSQCSPDEIRILVPGLQPVVARRGGSNVAPKGWWARTRESGPAQVLLTPTSATIGLVGGIVEDRGAFQAEVDQLRRRAWAVNVVVLMALLGLWQLFKLGGQP